MSRSVLVATALLPIYLSFCEAAVNYCGAPMCGKTDSHTFCQYPEGPSPTCSGYIKDRLSGEEKARLVARMNRRRNEAAQGKVENLPPASNMLRLRWVEELAREAQLWADQCRPPAYPELHDACRDLYAITVGQCVASVVGEAPGLRPESMADMWFLQGRQYRATHFMQSKDNKKSSADFEQMMWAHSYLVGCARSRFMIDTDGRQRSVTRLVCNLAPRGPGGPLWTPGAPASACPSGSRQDPSLPGLCTFERNETLNYVVANATIVKEKTVLDTILEIEQNESLNFRGSLDKIYLTKMVLASLREEGANTSNLEMNEYKTDLNISKNTTVMNTTDAKTVIDKIIDKKLKEANTTRMKRKKSTIGRPKSYNIEELNIAKDFGNKTTPPVEVVKEDDAYRDYDFDEVLFINDVDYDNSSSTESSGASGSDTFMDKAREMRTSTEKPSINISETTNSKISDTGNDTIYDLGDNTTYVQNDILKRLIELSKETEKDPSNPETAKQLQETLEQMEHALETPIPKKVRRELRSQSENQVNLLSSTDIVPLEKSYGQKLKDIGNIGMPDSAPVMNILSKYGTPILEKYGRMFAASAASNTTLSLVVFVFGSVSFMFNCYM